VAGGGGFGQVRHGEASWRGEGRIVG
jgi:hypothetical protein